MNLYTSKRTQYLIWFLIALLILSTAIFRKGWLMQQADPVPYLYLLFVSVGCAMSIYYLVQIIGFKGWWGLLFLSISDISIYIIIYIIGYSQKPISNGSIVLNLLKQIYVQSQNVLQYDARLSQFDSNLGYLYIPNIKSTFKNIEFNNNNFYTNSAGLRDDENSLLKPKIVVLGDSYTTGWGVNQEETYAHIIEGLTHKKVLNGGISSFGTVRETLLLNKIDIDSCQWLIIQYCLNDFEENDVWADSLNSYKPKFNRVDYNKRIVQNTVQNIYTPFLYSFLSIKIISKHLLAIKDPSEKWNNISSIPAQAETFLKILEIIKHKYSGNLLVISLSNSPHRLDRAFIQEATKQYGSKDNKVHFLDVGVNLGKLEHFVLDGHMNEKGHQKVANEIVSFLKNHERRQP